MEDEAHTQYITHIYMIWNINSEGIGNISVISFPIMVDRALEAGQRNLQRQINDLKSDTPTKIEFKELEDQVDKYHPVV